eukprot:8387109-Ditylum_brightwellii.AAC.1
MLAVQPDFWENSSLGLSDDMADQSGTRKADSDHTIIPPLSVPTLATARNDWLWICIRINLKGMGHSDRNLPYWGPVALNDNLDFMLKNLMKRLNVWSNH